jgi:hypothetical protein
MPDRQETDATRRPTGLTITAILMLLTAIGIVVYWASFLADLDAQRTGYFASRSEAWFAWELSFPLPDAWIAATALLGAVGLWHGRPRGLLFGLVSSGAMVFLGLIDLLFFLENGLFLPLNGEVVIQISIQVWMVGFGLLAIYTIWRHRDPLFKNGDACCGSYPSKG